MTVTSSAGELLEELCEAADAAASGPKATPPPAQLSVHLRGKKLANIWTGCAARFAHHNKTHTVNYRFV